MADSEASPVKSTIIMKVEGPNDESEKQENEENENVEKKSNIVDIKPSQICSPVVAKPILAQSRLGSSNPFATANTLSSPILRPSQLSCKANASPSKPAFTLNPSRLNPFAKSHSDDANGENKKSNQPQNGDAPKFVPLIVPTDKTSSEPVKPAVKNPASMTSSSNFVFGQNLQERVMADKIDDSKPSTSCLSSNGSTDMLFSSAIKEKVKEGSTSEMPNKEVKSLSESAREYEESRANKRKYEEVEVKTGEEEEINIVQISCKLFSYDKLSGSWQERGRGNLRLNDQEVTDNEVTYTQSRLVFRTSGSLRVILNTKIWAEMTIEQASAKSIRLTALDSDGGIKVFLIMANQEEIKHLYKQLDERVKNEKNKRPNSSSSLKKQATEPEVK